jgi:DNA-binding transcriptional LysR family regulator
MTDRFEAMSLLIAVVDAGSFSGAARQLGVPLPTVSRKISELETYLHTRVLQRSTRQLSLTEAGLSYVAACRRILEEIGEAERAVSGEYAAPKGDLVITTPIVFGRLHVLPVVTQFLKTYPEINVRIVLSDRLVHLLEEHVDVAIRVGELPDSSLVAARVGTIRRIVCASPAYLKEHGNPLRPQDLDRHQCITFDGLSSTREWAFRSGKSEMTVPVKSRLVVNTAEAAIAAAIDGLGLTRVLSYQVADVVRDNKLAITLQDHEPHEWPIHLVHAGQGLLPLKVRAFLDFAKPRLVSRLKDAAGMMAS